MHLEFGAVSSRASNKIFTMMTGKRPREPDGLDGDSKRIRSTNGSPAAAPPPTANGESEMERKKREAQERIAAMKARMAANKQNTAPPPPAPASPAPPAAGNDVDAKRAEAQKKIAEMKARMAAQRGQGAGSTASPVNGGAVATPPPSQMSDKEKRIAEARARAEERARKIEAERKPDTLAPPPRQDGLGARGGMGVALHPSLRDSAGGSVPSRGKAAAPGPKFSTTRGNQQPVVPKVNPYLADEDAQPQHFNDAIYDSSLAAKKGGERKGKQLVFNEKGKFMAQANALRQQARLEDMKRRIAAETRKTEIEEASDKSFLVPAPPDVEWWDEGLLPADQNSYENCLDPGRNKIEAEDSIITALVQHPTKYRSMPTQGSHPCTQSPSHRRSIARSSHNQDQHNCASSESL